MASLGRPVKGERTSTKCIRKIKNKNSKCLLAFSRLYSHSMHKPEQLTNIVYGFCGFVLLLVVVQWMLPERIPEVAPPAPIGACEGEPIFVTYAYTGAVNDPWECQVQCDDQKLRYIAYTNGLGTQCQDLPGCNDWGEDNGITCTTPNANVSPVTPAS